MTAFTSAGSKLYISAGTPASIDAAGFGALSYTMIGELTELGAIGPAVASVTHIPVDSGLVYKFKTTKDNGAMAIKGARVSTDPGQMKLIEAVDSYSAYAYKLVLQNGAIIYFQGLADSYKTNVGGAAQITSFDCNILVSGPVVNA